MPASSSRTRRRRIPLAVASTLFAASACGSAAAAEGPGAAPLSPAPEAAVAPVDTGTVRVTGNALVEVPADRARLRFAMETEAASAAEASDRNAEQMQAVLAAVRQAVAGQGSVETSGYSLSPVYSVPERGGAQRISGYRVQNSVVVTLEDVDRVGPVLDAAVRAGANRAADLSFFASNPRPARLEAIRRATAEAREEAEVLASDLGRSLGEVRDVNVSSPPFSPAPSRGVEMMLARADTPVEPGSQSVSVTVNLTFLLEGPGR